MAQSSTVEHFIDCPDCGPGMPARFNGAQWYCVSTNECKRRPLWTEYRDQQQVRISKPRTITVARLYGRQTHLLPACKPICTSGRRSCDCRCRGKCHGAGRCLGGHE